MDKPYYETEEYSEAENELDSYDDPIKLVMEYRISEKHKDSQIAELKKQLARLQTELHMKVDYIHELLEVKDDYKQQLHDLPKKIVCEISEAIERLSWRKRIYTNWEFDKEQLYKDLDTILKKFGKEDE